MSSIDKLKDIFKHFPTVGQRTASRFVYHLIKMPKYQVTEFLNAVQELSSKVKLCSLCFDPFEGEGALCPICQNPARNKQLFCIVEKETDLLSIENTKRYNGLYFILGGLENSSQLRQEEFKKRISGNNFSEIIIALNPTPEGRATSLFIESLIKAIYPTPAFKITHLARGIPVGGELEYADEETLQSALDGRK